MKMPFELQLGLLFFLIGLFTVLMKPYYTPDKTINLRKASIYHGLSLTGLGLTLMVIYFTFRYFEVLNYFPAALILTVISLVFVLNWLSNKVKDLSSCQTDQERKAYLHRSRVFSVIVVSLVSGFVVYPVIRSSFLPEISLKNNVLSISGQFGIEKNVNELMDIDTTGNYPKVSMNLGGGNFFGVYQGYFKCSEYRGWMFIKSNNPPFITMRLKDNKFILINFKDRNQTRSFFKTLQKSIHGTNHSGR